MTKSEYGLICPYCGTDKPLDLYGFEFDDKTSCFRHFTCSECDSEYEVRIEVEPTCVEYEEIRMGGTAEQMEYEAQLESLEDMRRGR